MCRVVIDIQVCDDYLDANTENISIRTHEEPSNQGIIVKFGKWNLSNKHSGGKSIEDKYSSEECIIPKMK